MARIGSAFAGPRPTKGDVRPARRCSCGNDVRHGVVVGTDRLKRGDDILADHPLTGARGEQEYWEQDFPALEDAEA